MLKRKRRWLNPLLAAKPTQNVLLVAALATAPLANAHGVHEHGAEHGHAEAEMVSVATLDAPVLLGNPKHRYQLVPGWGVAEGEHLGPTHGSVAIDAAGLIYVSLDSGDHGLNVHDDSGKLLKQLAPNLTGMHSLLCLKETDAEGNAVEHLYAARPGHHQVVKLNMDGSVVWTIDAPMASGVYNDAGQFLPTSVAVAPDGRVFVADGYGQNRIHVFDADGKYLETFGQPGNAEGQFQTCHGLALDRRGDAPRLLVCDRENGRLQYFDLDGQFLSSPEVRLKRPCAVSHWNGLLAVAELSGRVVLLDKQDAIVAVLGENQNAQQQANYDVPPTDWQPGVFNAPHGLSFDAAGNLYIEEWNRWGRLTVLHRVVDTAAVPAETSEVVADAG